VAFPGTDGAILQFFQRAEQFTGDHPSAVLFVNFDSANFVIINKTAGPFYKGMLNPGSWLKN